MRFFNHRGAFFEDEWLSVVDRGLFRLVVSQLCNRRQLAPEPLPERRILAQPFAPRRLAKNGVR